MKVFNVVLFIVSLFLALQVTAQNVKLVNRKTVESISIKTKKIKSIVSIDGQFYEGKAKIVSEGIRIGDVFIRFEEIGIIEAKKASVKKVVSFPLKAVGISSLALGSIMSAAFLSDEDSEPAVGIAGASLFGVGLGATLLGKKVGTEGSNSTLKSYHTRDWEFSFDE